MNRYEKYKDSGTQWLGEVPAHWEVKRLRFTLDINPVKSEINLSSDTLVSFIPMEAVNLDKNLTLTQEKIIDEVYKGYTYFKNDDVVLAKITPCFENGKSAIAQNLTNGIAFGTTELHVLRANQFLDNQFLYYLIKSDLFMKMGESEMYGAGGQKRVPEEFIKNFLIGLPPLPEQTAIAAYLDGKLSQIDALISKQETLLARLAEQRAATIAAAVTRGLNPNAPMKNSGIPWLGEVPAHWSICRLKDEVTVNDETLSDKTDLDYEILYVDISSVSLNKGIIQKEPMTFENSPSRARRIVKNGDVIVSTVRTYLKAITQINNSEDNLIVSTGFAVLRPKENLLPKFLGYWVQSEKMIGAIVANSVGVSYPAINATDLVRLPIVKLPLPEQTAIAEFLDQETAKTDRLCDKVQQAIGRLKDYRTALITQAVTGKIRVTEVHNV